MKRLPSTAAVNNAIQRELTSNFDIVKLVAHNMGHIKAANDLIASGAIENAAIVMAIKDQVMNVSSNIQAILDVAAIDIKLSELSDNKLTRVKSGECYESFGFGQKNVPQLQNHQAAWHRAGYLHGSASQAASRLIGSFRGKTWLVLQASTSRRTSTPKSA